MAAYLTEEKVKEYTNIFLFYQEQNRGTISIDSLRSILESMHIKFSVQRLQKLLFELTQDQYNEQVNIYQFLTIMALENSSQSKQMNKQIDQLFKIFDVNRNLQIQKEDLIEGFKQIEDQITLKEAQQILDTYGHVMNKNKTLSYQQFRNCLLKR